MTVRSRIAQLAAGGLILVSAPGCVYRFTNDHIVRPEGIRTVAVEAVYDTSREVLPHELLWQALQDAFAADGHLALVRQKEADALVRAHLRDARVTPAGSERANGPENDPTVEKGAAEKPDASKFRRMTQAGRYRDSGTVSFVVDVEVWSLRTRTVLMRRSYPMSTGFRAVHAEASVTTPANDFLRYDEAVAARFKALSQGMAQQVVRDLLVQ